MNQSPQPINTDAESELARVVGTTTKLLIKLRSFHKIVSSGLHSEADHFTKAARELLEGYSKTGEFNHWFVDGASWDDFLQLINSDPDSYRDKHVESNQSIIDAACIVFAHGILDDSVNGYLKVISMASPALWDSYLENKKVELKAIKGKTYEQIRKKTLRRLLDKENERLSFPNKLDLLHEISGVQEGEKFLENDFAYEQERLWKFHGIRINIVHGCDWDSHSFDFSTEYDYWFRLNYYLASLVCTKTGIKLSPKIAGQYFFE
jgi:hypothetical protein